MDPFVYQNPTRLIFGQGQLAALPDAIPADAKRVLLVYGGGSIKQNGIYDAVTAKLDKAGKEVAELTGVEPNPRLDTVHRGIRICREQAIDFLLAVGGGSVIDCTKAIAVGAVYEGDIWDIIAKRAEAPGALPFGTVLTLAATGSEMNPGSVITNEDTQEKLGWGCAYTYPRFSILDPAHTLTVPRDQTVYGIVDIMSHVLEQYFHHAHAPLVDRFAESILCTVIETAPRLVNDLHNITLRETILYAGTMALNGTLSMGARGDWSTHRIEHAVSAVYDIPHGGGLAILFPHWIRHTVKKDPSRARQLAIRVFGVDPEDKTELAIAEEGVSRLRAFWDSIGAPSRLADYSIDDSQLERLVDKTMLGDDSFGRYQRLTRQDVERILQAAL